MNHIQSTEDFNKRIKKIIITEEEIQLANKQMTR